ncbi:hypothetical protein CRUP_019506 [Coryphaenoides rupestris]|nr:hypothetical protein CRUP_019506 [Coryphaenoides rupestris]
MLYSGSVGDLWYRAELGLSGSVDPEACSWTMKSNQPVMLLLKEPARRWKQLLKHKNHLVSYDLEHWEDEDEEENATTPGVCFMEDTGEGCVYVLDDDDSDSD